MELPALEPFSSDSEEAVDALAAWKQEETANNKPSFVMGIDPGFVHQGWVKAEYTIWPEKKEVDLKVVKSGTFKINDSAKMTPQEMTDAESRFFHNVFGSDKEAKSYLIVLESTYGPFQLQKQKNQQGKSPSTSETFLAQQLYALYSVLVTMAAERAEFVETIHPNTVKSRFHIQGQNYAENKKFALLYCQQNLGLANIIKNDHEADALLLICCYLQNPQLFPNYRIRVHV